MTRRRIVVAAAGIAAALGMSGCWLQPGGGPSNARANTQESELTRANVEGLDVAWESGTDGTLSEPVVSGGRVFTTGFMPALSGDPTMSVQAHDVATGALLWERDLRPDDPTEEGFAHPVAVIDGAVWVTYYHNSCVGTLERLDPASGAVLSSEAIGMPQSSPVASGGVVASVEMSSGCRMARLVVRDLETRAVEWVYPFTSGTGLSTPTFADGRIVVDAFIGRDQAHATHAWDVAGCDATSCAPDWTYSVPGTRTTQIRPAAGPGGQVYVFTEGGGLPGVVMQALDTRTGQVRWRTAVRYTGDQPAGTWGLAVDGDTLYISGYEGSTWDEGPVVGRVDAYAAGGCGRAECDRLWSAELGEDVRPGTAPALAGGVVYVGTRAGPDVRQPAVVAVDAAGCGQPTCAPVVEVPLVADTGNPAIVGSDPLRVSVAAGHVFVSWLGDLFGSDDGTLVALAVP